MAQVVLKSSQFCICIIGGVQMGGVLLGVKWERRDGEIGTAKK